MYISALELKPEGFNCAKGKDEIMIFYAKKSQLCNMQDDSKIDT